MTVYLVGTSHLHPLRAMAHQGTFDKNRKCRWYYLSNSGYAEGDFVWTESGVSHTSPAVLERWIASSGRNYIPVKHDDTVVAFGFDDRAGRYGFLAGDADHVSSACRKQAIRDIINASPAFRLQAVLRDKMPNVRMVIVEPPILSRSEQQKKFSDRLVLRSRLEELSLHYAAAAAISGVGYMAQAGHTLNVEGDFTYTRDELLALDGYHWGGRGIEIVRRDLTAALGL